MNHLLGDDAGCNYSQGEPAAEMAAAAGVIVSAILEICREVCVTGPGVLAEILIVFRARVVVSENDSQGCTGSVSFINACENLWSIGLQTGGCTGPARLTAENIVIKVFFTERNSGKYAVHCYSDDGAVGLAEDADFEVVAKSIHSLSNNSLNVGNDFATQAVSSIVTGLSAPREATLRAMTMRWSPKDG